ncbi:hypothetical protein BD560DRAFT_422971 [Blakeslea trispora]|nr:hypothetical protein BD560DRAFT_422971 [Blakeslea trispora]
MWSFPKQAISLSLSETYVSQSVDLHKLENVIGYCILVIMLQWWLFSGHCIVLIVCLYKKFSLPSKVYWPYGTLSNRISQIIMLRLSIPIFKHSDPIKKNESKEQQIKIRFVGD